jgi:alpha-L-fucosidase
MRFIRTFPVILLLSLLAGPLLAAAPKDPARLEWFNEAKFGMFIHWGVYSAIAGEWKGRKEPGFAEWAALQFNIPGPDYEEIARHFNPTKFNAEDWVRTAKDAGMRYIVLTSKHHDGFCMFATKQTDFNIVDYTPFKRDVVKEMAEACKKYDMKFGLYYSLVDWHHPEFPKKYVQRNGVYHMVDKADADVSKYADYQIAQLKELLSNYGDICIVWFDAGGAFRNADRYGLLKGDEVFATIRKLQPDCLINNRLGGDFDYGTPEQKIPGAIQDQAFETCMTIGKKWGYNKFDTTPKSAQELVRNLIDIAHKGGNFLLNVGPTDEGLIQQSNIDRLHEVGKWLEVNGESIYGTKNSPFAAELPWGRSTTALRDGGESTRLFLHVFDWPKDGKLLVPGLKNKGKVYLLSDYPAHQLKTQYTDAGVVISGLPAQAPDPIATVLVMEFKGRPKVDQPATKPADVPVKNAAE